MSNKITAYKVKNLSNVNTTLYKEGDHFITNKSAGVLVNGKVVTITNDLTDYVKKNAVKKMVKDILKEEGVINE